MTSAIDYIRSAASAALAAYALATESEPGTFVHGSDIDADLETKFGPLPLVLLFDPTTNQKAATSRVSRADCTLYFGDKKPGQGDSPEVEEATVLRMQDLKKRLLAALDASPVVELTNLRDSPFHNAYSAELTGVGLQFTLGVPAGALVC